MYIAICDDDPAIRIHHERLLRREASLLLKENLVLYIDAFSLNLESVGRLMKYDVFFINSAQRNACIKPSIAYLRSFETPALIYFYNISNKFKTELPILPNVYYIDEYIKADDLHQIISQTLSYIEKKPKTIEVRLDKTTRYLIPDNILYIKKTSPYVLIRLVDGEELKVLDNSGQFLDNFIDYPFFMLTQKEYAINKNHISEVKFKKVILHNLYAIPLKLFEYISLNRSFTNKNLIEI